MTNSSARAKNEDAKKILMKGAYGTDGIWKYENDDG